MNTEKGRERRASMFLDDFADAMAEVAYRKEFKETVTFDEVVQYALEEKKKEAKIEAFVVSVKKNYEPKNENDKFLVIQGMLDGNNKPITFDGKKSESRIIHTRTIDKKFIEVLNGAETKLIKL